MEARCDAGRADARARLLAAAARVYARHGQLGATTRLIAEEAGVNEVTLFRLFGSKAALLDEAVRVHATRALPAELPDVPVDPERELADWCAGELARLGAEAELLRQCFAGSASHSVHAEEAGMAIGRSADVLRAYVRRLPTSRHGADADIAVAMLVSTLLADALARDDMPAVYAIPRADAPLRYARTFLRALG
jgi:AcrR family transcriptional regulator